MRPAQRPPRFHARPRPRMRPISGLAVAGLAAAAALALAACAGTGTGTDPGSTPFPIPSVTASVPMITATPPATPTDAPATGAPQPAPASDPDPADPSTWTIGFDGIGPITLGTPLSEVEAIVAPTDSCRPGVDSFFDSTVVASTDGGTGEGDTATVGLVISQSVAKSSVTGIPTTAEGIGVGSTIDELLAAYPDAEPYEAVNSTAYRITDGTTYIHFDDYGKGTIQIIEVTSAPIKPKEYCG
ncbi:hypothetical protein SCB71_16045 [Herbiconiux sp. KACC 21604]|uniref:hypothetical protein n=1 Tax=unclassified Herbiconiux TaxID=2618217 RepID=UPI001492BC12|nr:hypothetical protein [Herbiconiux sp. SALV-R1]QJU54626.1 hypothetical protein HL652_14005 [Herbiconiux sp. SALV-R1]WPO85718.1 hypothetical protein SCB71_16045 [Herbiconiux sp. KACC 21604]